MGLAQSKGEPVAMWVLGRRRLGGSLMMVVSSSRKCRGVRDRGKKRRKEREARWRLGLLVWWRWLTRSGQRRREKRRGR
ncbi:hypothetical protein AHAS_Ahas16G0254600 [Arachis hypogaea]